MNVRSCLCLLLMMSFYAVADDTDPVALLNQARQLEDKKHDYKKALILLEQASAIWESRGTTVEEYGESLTLAAILLIRKSGGDGNLMSSACEKLSRAISIYRANQSAGAEDLALALEAQALISAGKQMAGTVAWKEAADIRANHLNEGMVIRAGIDTPPIHLNASDSSVKPAKVISIVQPEYSASARILRITGLAKMTVIIETDGTTTPVAIERGLGFGLDEEAAKALRQWRFQAASKDGVAVRSYATIEIKFRLI